MFSPLAMGTNHMLGIDTFVPLTVNNFEVRVYNMDGTQPTEFSDLLTLSTDEVGNISETAGHHHRTLRKRSDQVPVEGTVPGCRVDTELLLSA